MPRVDLVQGYDECLMSYSESKDVLAPTGVERSAGGRTIFHHAILSDGRLVGHWRHVPGKRSVGIETSLSRRLVANEKIGLDQAVERFGRFLGMPASLV